MVEKAKYIWLDGDFIPWDEARVHILTHSLHYGLGVFEGIRAYHCQDGRTAIFRLKEHIRRLFDAAHVMQLDIPFPPPGWSPPAWKSYGKMSSTRPTCAPWSSSGTGSWGSIPPTTPSG